MPKQTPNFNLGMFCTGEFTDAVTESNRWNTVDNLLQGLYTMIGNGVVKGWELSVNTGLSINIAPGQGVISKVSAESTTSFVLASLVPNATNYIYAVLTPTSYWDGGVTFQTMVSNSPLADAVLLGSVTTNSTDVTAIDSSLRTDVGLMGSILDAVKAHRHTGAPGQPAPVDLSADVQGQIAPANLPAMDASLITTGTLAATAIPKIDHTTGLANVGALTHAQLDSLVESLVNPDGTLMGGTALVNFLQLVLAIKGSVDPYVDEEMVNELAYIPGISPDQIVDTVNTTATIDKIGHKITVSASGGDENFSKTWSRSDQFSQAALTNTAVNGDKVELDTTEIRAEVEDFEDVSDWAVAITDLSSPQSAGVILDPVNKVQGATSGQFDVNTTVQNNLTLTMSKTFAPQDWTKYNRIVFQINTASLTHGNIQFYLQDSIAGIQNSYTLVLEAGSPTINRDTLQVGWREISLDISAYTRSSIVTVGFFTSTQIGWNPAAQFQLNVDDMYLTTGNEFEPNGSALFTFGQPGFPVTWKQLQWDSLVPTDSSLQFRWREADTIGGMGAWSDYSTTSPVAITSTTKALIQIEASFTSSSDQKYSPELHRLAIGWSAVSVQSAFTYETQAEWESGTLSNIDTTTTPGSIQLKDIPDAYGSVYGTAGGLVKADDGDWQQALKILGLALPRSTQQVLNGLPAGFGQVTSFAWGPDSTFFLTDTENDRVVQVNSSGQLLFGLYGSFLQDPADPYGNEDNGPAPGVATPVPTGGAPTVLHAIYNPTTAVLSVIFDHNLEQVNDSATKLAPNKFYLAIGSNRVHFGPETTFQLWGIDEPKVNAWASTGNVYLPQFMQQSHILQVTLSQADAATVNSLINFNPPSLVCSAPLENEIYPYGNPLVVFGISNLTLGGATNYRIHVVLSGPSSDDQYLSVNTITYSGLQIGRYTITATLVDGNNLPLSNPEANLTTHFVVTSNATPVMCPLSTPNQRISNNAVSIAYSTPNFTLGNVPGGPQLMYRLDGGAYSAWNLTPQNVNIEDLSAGKHTVDFYLSDADHLTPPDPTSFRGASISFNVGISSLAGLKLYTDQGAIHSSDQTLPNPASVTTVESGNIFMANTYAPLEVQYLASEMSLANPSGMPSLVVGKLRSQSASESITTAPQVPSTGDAKADLVIFGTRYLDGHSVVQFNLNGKLLFSNNAAKFGELRADAAVGLGGVKKTNVGELMIADAVQQRAIITHTNLADQSTFVAWQYDSDRQVTDFRIVSSIAAVIGLTQTTVDTPELLISSGTSVTWTNNSPGPQTIYSGSTTMSQFNGDPDLTLYGKDFISSELKPGESFSRSFSELGDFNWFAYPAITGAEVTGLIRVSANRIGPNDKYIIVENDPTAEITSGRVIQVDAWGNILWIFGEGLLYNPRDARPLPDGSIVIST